MKLIKITSFIIALVIGLSILLNALLYSNFRYNIQLKFELYPDQQLQLLETISDCNPSCYATHGGKISIPGSNLFSEDIVAYAGNCCELLFQKCKSIWPLGFDLASCDKSDYLLIDKKQFNIIKNSTNKEFFLEFFSNENIRNFTQNDNVEYNSSVKQHILDQLK